MANSPFIQAGTVTLTESSNALTGAGTTFNQFIANATTMIVYDTANDKTHVVGIASITDNITATIQGNWPHPTLTNASYFAQVLSNDIAGLQEAVAKMLAFIDSVNTISTSVETLSMLVQFGGINAVRWTADGSNGILAVSTNGTSWTNAISIDRTTGVVTFPNNVVFTAGLDAPRS